MVDLRRLTARSSFRYPSRVTLGAIQTRRTLLRSVRNKLKCKVNVLFDEPRAVMSLPERVVRSCEVVCRNESSNVPSVPVSLSAATSLLRRASNLDPVLFRTSRPALLGQRTLVFCEKIHNTRAQSDSCSAMGPPGPSTHLAAR